MKLINLCHPIHQECLFLMNSAPINVEDDMKEKRFNRFSATLSEPNKDAAQQVVENIAPEPRPLTIILLIQALRHINNVLFIILMLEKIRLITTELLLSFLIWHSFASDKMRT